MEPEKAKCSHCRTEGPRDRFAWMAHELFCQSCIRSLVRHGWAKRGSKDYPHAARAYQLTDRGASYLPALETIAYCPQDGMPIYRGWVEAGIATREPSPACPWCIGRAAEIKSKLL
jgi:hypothetical protein